MLVAIFKAPTFPSPEYHFSAHPRLRRTSLQPTQDMTVIASRCTRSTTLWLGHPSSLAPQPRLKLCLRKSLAGHWNLVDFHSHKSLYHISIPRSDGLSSTNEIRKGSWDGPLLGRINLQFAGSLCQLAFADGQPEIQLASRRILSIGDRHPFEAKGLQLEWKRDVVCRDSHKRKVYAKTDGDMLLIYETPEELLDILVIGFIAMKLKYQ